MFNNKHGKCRKTSFWMIAAVLVALVVTTLILQAQIFVMLKDMQTSIFSTFFVKQELVSEGVPLPPGGMVMDGIPLPPKATFRR